MKCFKVLLFGLIFSLSAMAGQFERDGLSEVERSSCLMFPQITALTAATPGLQYKVEKEYIDCNRDCGYNLKLKLDYRHARLTVVDYFNSAGKLVTSQTLKTTEKMNQEVLESPDGEWNYDSYETGELPADSAAQTQLTNLYSKGSEQVLLEIRRKIYDGAEACAGSFYK